MRAPLFLRRVVAGSLAAMAFVPVGATAASPSPSPSPDPCASASPTPSPSPAATATASATPAASPSGGTATMPSPSLPPTAAELAAACADARLLADVRLKLGADLADAVTAQQYLAASIAENGHQQADLAVRVSEAKVQVAALDAALERSRAEQEATAARIAGEEAQLAALERVLYEHRQGLIAEFARAGSLRDALIGAADLLSAGNRADQVRSRLLADGDALATQRKRMEADRTAADRARADLQDAIVKLTDLQVQQEASAASLETRIDATKAELAREGIRSAEVARAIEDLIKRQQAEVIAAAYQQAWAQATILAQVGLAGTRPSHAPGKTRLAWPMPGAVVTQGFGPSSLALEPPYGPYPHFHTGIDLAMPEGTPVGAADSGIVAAVGSGTTGPGNFVIVAHAGGLMTFYGHLAQALVKVGERVEQGKPIGLEGSTGNSTGPHCHFEARQDGTVIDPIPLLPKQP